MSGYTSIIRREAVGVIGQIAPLELPADDGGLEDRPGAGGREHGRPQARRDHPLSILKAAEYAAEIFPAGVLNVITGHGNPTGQTLVTHPDVDMVSLTGSVGTGKWIAAHAADTLKRVHLELGRQGAGGRVR